MQKGLGRGYQESQHELPFLKRKEPLDKRFQDYHEANPHVFEMLVEFSKELKSAGVRNYGLKGMFERLRWHFNFETKDKAGFKLNNDYSSRYARKLENEFPEFKGFYRMRKLRS